MVKHLSPTSNANQHKRKRLMEESMKFMRCRTSFYNFYFRKSEPKTQKRVETSYKWSFNLQT